MTQERRSIVVLPGDGIGQEVTAGAVEVIRNRAERHGMAVEIQEYPVGGAAIRELGQPLPDQVLQACRRSGSVLLGAVGDSAFDGNPPEMRPERAILGLRKELGLFANLRPVTAFDALLSASTLKTEVVEGVDILFVRELTGGIYFGTPRGREQRPQGEAAFDTEVYYDYEVERIARTAFRAARRRKGRVTSVDKSNVLESSRLWREVVEEVSADYPDVELEHMLVDNCAMQLIRRPTQFDVLLTSNMFGDILSDEASMLTGSLGMLPSASLGEMRDGNFVGLYEPVHGSAPDIAGKDLANPLAAILSAALLLRHSLGRDDIALEIEAAVQQLLDEGLRTADIAAPGQATIGTRQMAKLVCQALK
ncbi:MAG: 3-isopropylmalate dehydrogenase [Acidobacteriota bacterium]